MTNGSTPDGSSSIGMDAATASDPPDARSNGSTDATGDGASGEERRADADEAPRFATPGEVDARASYVVRQFEPGDREAFVSLYDEVFGGGGDRWFRWKYLDNPTVSHVPIVVADADGELAGARPQVPFRMRAGDRTVLAFRFGDTMVHPDHRRRGVFTTLADHVLDEYAQTAPAFGFNCPNEVARQGFTKVGGRVVGTHPSWYRIQRPGALDPGAGDDDGTLRRAALVAGPLLRGFNRVAELTAPSTGDVRVVRHSTFPVDRLAALYRRAVPDRVHAVRDEQFLDWRYRNPEWEYTAYVAERGGDAVAGAITGTQARAERTVTNLVDVLPMVSTERRDRALPALLTAVVREHRDADLLAYSGRTIPRSLLARFGFRPDDSLPLSRVASPTRLVAYDVGDGRDWHVDGVDLRRPENWALTYAELDAR